MQVDDKFSIELQMKNNVAVLKLSGRIDEDASFEKLKKAEEPIIINFRNVTAIDSLGVRNWVNFLKSISGKEIYFEECPPVIVRQMNMIPNFVGDARVMSVFIRYVCEKCEKEKMTLVMRKDFENATESMPCGFWCKGVMEFDGHPRQYFAFVR